MALIDEIATMAEIDVTKYSSYLSINIPILIDWASEYCNNTFDKDNPPSGVKMFLAKTIQYNIKSKSRSSRSMGSVSESFDTNIPDEAKKDLRPYRKVRFV